MPIENVTSIEATYNKLVEKITSSTGITLLAGTAYQAGDIVVSNGLKFEHIATPLSTVATFNSATVLVLTQDYDATSADMAAVGHTGIFNEDEITLGGSQSLTDVRASLLTKDIILRKWSV